MAVMPSMPNRAAAATAEPMASPLRLRAVISHRGRMSVDTDQAAVLDVLVQPAAGYTLHARWRLGHGSAAQVAATATAHRLLPGVAVLVYARGVATSPKAGRLALVGVDRIDILDGAADRSTQRIAPERSAEPPSTWYAS